MAHRSLSWRRVFLLLQLAPSLLLAQQQSPLQCVTDAECEELYRKGSKCLESGSCSNPYVSGCLHAMNPEDYHKRICNSDDVDQERCRTSPTTMAYPEIRVHNQDWEVAIILSWIVQVYLMELLDVPVSVGLGNDTAISSFYSMETALPFSRKTYSFDAIEKANEVGGNCMLTEEDCVHLIPDVWLGQKETMLRAFDDGQIDYLDGNGQVGKISWYIPAFTAARHPLTVTHVGMEGKNEELAAIFKRPTTWLDYCHDVSLTNCSTPDEVAERYPQSAEEQGKYFADGYIGHFRDTIDNNCTLNNGTTCTGHIVNAPCKWSTFLESQAYHNNIPLKSNGKDANDGYAYHEMLEIWAAANATRSDVIMWWYEPDPAVQLYRGGDFAFTKVHLPSPSVECRESRVSPQDRCSPDPAVRRGTMEGSCDNIGHTTKKAIASSLRDMTISTPEVDQSPGYYAIRNFNIDDLDLHVILKTYVDKGKTGQAARDAVCEWVHDNIDLLEKYTPIGYPRKIQGNDDSHLGVTATAQVMGIIATLYVLIAFALTYRMRKARVFVYAQVQFIFLILLGLLLVAISSILHSISPNDSVCVSQFWLVSLGYTCELVPLIIKVSAMNHLMRASKRMRRVNIKPSALYAKAFFLTSIVTICLIVWTVVDPPTATEFRSLSEDKTTISSEQGCSSNSEYWVTVSHFWEGLLIVWAFVLAFQSRTAKAEFNESRSVGTMIYSHFVFAVLRVVVYLIFDDDPYTTAIATSFLLSVDVISALTLYLVPKWIKNGQTINERRSRRVHVSETVRSVRENADDTAKDIPTAFEFGKKGAHLLFSPVSANLVSSMSHSSYFSSMRGNGFHRPDFDEEDDPATAFKVEDMSTTQPVVPLWDSSTSRTDDSKRPERKVCFEDDFIPSQSSIREESTAEVEEELGSDTSDSSDSKEVPGILKRPMSVPKSNVPRSARYRCSPTRNIRDLTSETIKES
eukprot:scaffold1004_cov105-Cylindrotheca_fusiformis.AAC.6